MHDLKRFDRSEKIDSRVDSPMRKIITNIGMRKHDNPSLAVRIVRISTDVIRTPQRKRPVASVLLVEFRMTAGLVDNKLRAIPQPFMMTECDEVSWLDEHFWLRKLNIIVSEETTKCERGCWVLSIIMRFTLFFTYEVFATDPSIFWNATLRFPNLVDQRASYCIPGRDVLVRDRGRRAPSGHQ
jgi:hypothetical protein